MNVWFIVTRYYIDCSIEFCAAKVKVINEKSKLKNIVNLD